MNPTDGKREPRTRAALIEKLGEMNFKGPFRLNGHEYMLYHGRTLILPPGRRYSVPQIRYFLRHVDQIASAEEWRR